MSPLEELLLVVAVLYLYESALFVPRRASVFTSWLGRRFRIRHPADFLGNERVGVIVASLLPPLGTVHVSERWPFALSPAGLISHEGVAVAQVAGGPIPFSAAPEALSKLRIRFDSAEAGRIWAARLRELAALPEAARAEAIRAWLRASLDAGAVRERAASFRARTGSLRVLANALFVFFFVLLPWQGFTIGLLRAWPGLALAFVALTTATVWTFVRVHRDLFPARAPERRALAVALALAPLEAVRAVDAVARGLLADRHPVAVALALARPADAEALARREMLAALHPMNEPGAASPAPDARSVRDWFISAWASELRAALERHGLDVGALLAAPMRDSPESQRYCPRCRSQYGNAVRACADCPGVELAEFEDTPARA